MTWVNVAITPFLRGDYFKGYLGTFQNRDLRVGEYGEITVNC